MNIAQIFGTYSNDDLATAIALRHPKRSNIEGNDVGSIFNYLRSNPDYENNNYARLEELAAQNKYGNGIPEVQDALKEWEIDIDMATRE